MLVFQGIKSQELTSGVGTTMLRTAPVLLGSLATSTSIQVGGGGHLALPEIEDEFLQSSPNPPGKYSGVILCRITQGGEVMILGNQD